MDRWKLRGHDTFAGEDYPLPGEYSSEGEARRAAREYLKEVERTQPSKSSGGQRQGGIQDRVFVIRPDGSGYRYVPDNRQEDDPSG